MHAPFLARSSANGLDSAWDAVLPDRLCKTIRAKRVSFGLQN
jgi:hypothetical protein